MPFATQAQIIAPYTWEVGATLSRTSEETRRIPVRFPRPVRVVGMYPSVIAGSAVGGLVAPSCDAILAVVSSNQRDRFTNRLEDVSSAGYGEAYVTLSALGTSQLQGNRLMNIELKEASPQLDLGFRWKRWSGSPIYEDAIIHVALFCEYLDG